MLKKIVTTCTECHKEFVLVIKAEDINDLSVCPFCGTSLDIAENNNEESEE